MRVFANSSFCHLTRLRINKKHILYIASILMMMVAFIFLTHLRPIRASATFPATTRSKFGLARMSAEVSIHAAGRGAPYISLSDGREVLTTYEGPQELTNRLANNQAKPLSLASADFDEDGVSDLVNGYAGPEGGIITLLRGNVDSIYPNAPAAKQHKADGRFTDAPFLSPSFVFGVPEAVDFVGAGDFDGDSHWDVVAARRAGNKLYLLSGDGRGGLKQTRQIELPGKVTTLATGEINRRDGLDDIVVAVNGENGAKVLVYEGPDGALRAKPEVFDAPEEVTSLALGQLDDSYEIDLAVASGQELMLVHGRDRKLSLDAERQQEVKAARVEPRRFSFGIRSIAVGDFTGNHSTDIALLGEDGGLRVLSAGAVHSASQKVEGVSGSIGIEKWHSEELASNGGWSEGARLVCARVANMPVDNLIVLDRANHLEVIARIEPMNRSQAIGGRVAALLLAKLEVEGEAMAVLPMRLNPDALNDLVLLHGGSNSPSVVSTQAIQALTVTNTNDGGPGSLRQAILDSNSNLGTASITFAIGSGAKTINLISALPSITDTVTIDATTQPGFAGKPIIELNGSGTAPGASGLNLVASNCLIRGFVINRFHRNETTFFGGNGIDIQFSSGSIIEGNFIGSDINGLTAMGNINGIFLVTATNNLIGGTTTGARNVISGNFYGLLGFNNSSGNAIRGNFIGTDLSGMARLANQGNGAQLNGLNNTIGGTLPAARNLISGNSADGILINSGSSGTLVQGNFIGTDATGTGDLGNSAAGVDVNFQSNNTLGGTTAAARNVISGNAQWGVIIGGPSATANLIQGNFIGTSVDGTTGVSNLLDGVEVVGEAHGNTIGGMSVGASNLISGNHGNGILFEHSAMENQVLGNYVGIDVTGHRALGNLNGITLSRAPNNSIGNSVAEGRNIISGNRAYGVAIGLITAQGNFGETGAAIIGNYIGTDSSGSAPLGNALDGIFVENNSVVNTLEGNRIAFNQGNGIHIPDDPFSPGIPNNPAVRISLLSNSIYSNSQLGIDLGPLGLTSNPGNREDGANHHQNFPELTSAVVSNRTILKASSLDTAAIVTVSGNLNASPNTTYKIQFFLGGSCQAGQGHQFTGLIPILLDTRDVTTGSNGIAAYSFDLPLPGTDFNSGWINATATDPVGNTSELSSCQQVSGTLPPPGPTITNVQKEGKNFTLTGTRFVNGAKLLVNGIEKKTRVDSTTSIFSKKGAKAVTYPAHLQLRNPDNSLSNEYIFNQP